MTLTPNPPSNAGGPRVWRSFVIIVLGFVLSVGVSIYEMRNSQTQIRLIARHAATNIELVSRLSRDLDRKHFLIENHIRENDFHDMDRIEAELAAVEGQIASTSSAYEPIDADTGERYAWQELIAGIATLEPQVIGIVSLSRKNADDAALASCTWSTRNLNRLIERRTIFLVSTTPLQTMKLLACGNCNVMHLVSWLGLLQSAPPSHS